MFSFSYFLLVNFDPTKGFIKADSKSTLNHFIMNHHELLTILQSCQAILMFLVNRGLLAARHRCSCGNQMVLRHDKSDDGYHWNVQLTSAKNEGRSELDFFSNIQKSHCRTGSTSSSSGRLTSLIKKYRYWPDCHFVRSSRHFRGSETSAVWKFYMVTWSWAAEEKRSRSTSPCMATNASTTASRSVKACRFLVWLREALDELWHSTYRTGQEKPGWLD